MKSLITLLTLGLILISCSDSKKKDKGNESFIEIDGWDVIIEKGVTDTLNVESWIPKSELSLQFVNKVDSTCQMPNLEFYPIELEEYIEQKLMNYLVLRATLFPPAPNTYMTKNHFIIGWNFVDYGSLKCCECPELESELIKKLKLVVKAKPKEMDFTE